MQIVFVTTPEPDRSAPGAGYRSQIRLDLPCVRCGYNLRGLPPQGVCPECGGEVRATLLYVVDPARSEIEPLEHPQRLGRALVTIAGALFAAALLQWLPHAIQGVVQVTGAQSYGPRAWSWLSSALAGLLGLIAVAGLRLLRRPTGSPAGKTYQQGLRMARLGIGAWSLLLFVQASYDLSWGGQWWWSLAVGDIDPVRVTIRLWLTVFAIIAMLGVRPVIRFLGIRSVNHRMGRISRQGFTAMIVAAIVVALGDLIQIVLPGFADAGAPTKSLETWSLVSLVMVLVGSAMLTLALGNIFLDFSRLARGLTQPSYRFDEVVAPDGLNGSASREPRDRPST